MKKYTLQHQKFVQRTETPYWSIMSTPEVVSFLHMAIWCNPPQSDTVAKSNMDDMVTSSLNKEQTELQRKE